MHGEIGGRLHLGIICILIADTFCCTEETNMECKAVILQLKIKIKKIKKYRFISLYSPDWKIKPGVLTQVRNVTGYLSRAHFRHIN